MPGKGVKPSSQLIADSGKVKPGKITGNDVDVSQAPEVEQQATSQVEAPVSGGSQGAGIEAGTLPNSLVSSTASNAEEPASNQVATDTSVVAGKPVQQQASSLVPHVEVNDVAQESGYDYEAARDKLQKLAAAGYDVNQTAIDLEDSDEAKADLDEKWEEFDTLNRSLVDPEFFSNSANEDFYEGVVRKGKTPKEVEPAVEERPYRQNFESPTTRRMVGLHEAAAIESAINAPLGPEVPGFMPGNTVLQNERTNLTSNTAARRQEEIKQEAKLAVGKKNGYAGWGIYGTFVNDEKLPIDEISVSKNALAEAIAQEDKHFFEYIRYTTGEDLRGRSIDDIQEFVNSRVGRMRIPVTIVKSPVLTAESSAVMYLRIDNRDGIRQGPNSMKKFNGDLDGDAGSVAFNFDLIKPGWVSPMNYLINLAGETTIDFDFWPTEQSVFKFDSDYREVNKSTTRKYFKIHLGRGYSPYLISDEHFDKIVDAVNDLYWCADSKGEDAKKFGAKMILAIRDACEAAPGTLDEIKMAGLMDYVYGISKAEQVARFGLSSEETVDFQSELKPPSTDLTPNDRKVYELTQDMYDAIVTRGSGTVTWHDARTILGDQLGEEKGKNPAYRMHANVAIPFVNFDSRVMIGSSLKVVKDGVEKEYKIDSDGMVEIPVGDLADYTFRMALSRAIRSEAFRGENAKNASEILSTNVKARVGLPYNYDNNWESFFEAFKTAYILEASLMQSADVAVYSDMSIGPHWAKSENTRILSEDPTLGDIIPALLDVYGDYEFEKFFKNMYNPDEVTDDYYYQPKGKVIFNQMFTGRTLRYLSLNNMVYRPAREMQEIKDLKINGYTGGPDYSNKITSDKVLFAICDQKSSGARTFRRVVYGNDETMAGFEYRNLYGLKEVPVNLKVAQLVYELTELEEAAKEPGSKDSIIWAQKLIDLLFYASPDMFTYFGMTDVEQFFSTEYGKTMRMIAMQDKLRPQDVMDKMGSLRIAMLVDLRTHRIEDLRNQTYELYENAPYTKVNGEQAYTDQIREENKLASSSIVWRVIVDEMRSSNQTSAYYRLANRSYEECVKIRKDGEEEGRITNYKKWDSYGPELYNTHPDILSVLRDVTISLTDKEQILSDVVSVWQGEGMYFSQFDVVAGLESGTNVAYSTLAPQSTGLLSVANEFNKKCPDDRVDGYKAIVQDVRNARYDKEAGKPGRLTKLLTELADNPDVYITMDDTLFADAMTSSANKVYVQKDKGKQHPNTNINYNSVSILKNHGLFSDVYRTDNKVLGILSAEQLSNHDIIRVLAHPGLTLYVPDRRGHIAEVNTKNLVGAEHPTEEQLWDFFEANPAIAACLRLHKVSTIPNADGKCFVSASTSIRDTLADGTGQSPKDAAYLKLEHALYDHPSFAALVSITTPTVRRSSRKLRGSYVYRKNAMINDMVKAVAESDSVSRAADVLVDHWHLKYDNIKNAEAEFHDGFKDLTGEPEYKISEEYARRLGGYDNGNKGDIRTDLEGLLETEWDNLKQVASYGEEFEWSTIWTDPDLSACYAYYDIRQDFAGSKTQISTGVEGYETWRLAAALDALRVTDKYASLTQFEDKGLFNRSELLESYGNCMTSLGKPLSDLTPEEWESDEEIVVSAPGMYIPDKTSGWNQKQVPSLYSYLIIKRDHGAEKYNLKAKKSGNDGLDSITKSSKYFSEREKKRIAEEYGDIGSTEYDSILEEVQSLYKLDDVDSQFQAKMYIAQKLYKANMFIGYDDMTLADCMNIADLMIGVDPETGVVRLRSLEMLSTAIKTALTYEITDRADEEEITAVAQAAAAEAGRLDGDVRDAIRYIKVAPSNTGSSTIRFNDSSFSMNHDFIMEIYKQEGLIPREDEIDEVFDEAKGATYQSRRELYEERFKKNRDKRQDKGYQILLYNEAKSEHKKYITQLEKKEESKDFAKLIKQSGYILTGWVHKNMQESQKSVLIGPQGLIYISSDATDEQVEEWLTIARRLGVNVMFQHSEETIVSARTQDLLDEYLFDTVAFPGDDSENYWLIPMWSMKRTGSEVLSHETSAAPGMWIGRRPMDNIVVGHEDSLNHEWLGDAGAKIFKSLINKTHIRWNDQTDIQYTDMFRNTYHRFPRAKLVFSQPTIEEIRQILNPAIETRIDFGVVRDAEGYSAHRHRIVTAISRYKMRYNQYKKGFITDDAKPGDVIGWVKCDVYDDVIGHHVVYAPIIPFDMTGNNGVSKQGVPSKFRVTDYRIDPGKWEYMTDSCASIKWTYTDGIAGHILKFFEWAFGADKMMVAIPSDEGEESPVLSNAMRTPIDIRWAAQSTASRRLGPNKRLGTLQTLMFFARIDGYNFADCEYSFPGDPMFERVINEETGEVQELPIRETLQTGWITGDEWKKILDKGITWVGGIGDAERESAINAFINVEIRKFMMFGGNPTDYLVSRFNDGNNGFLYTDIWWEFECMFRNTLDYQDGLMNFLNLMNPNLCASNIHDHGENYIFKCMDPDPTDGATSYCMYMKVPYSGYTVTVGRHGVIQKTPNGETDTKWEPIFAGWDFFNFNDFSGNKRPNINGGSDFLDAIAVRKLSGYQPSKWTYREFLKWSMSDNFVSSTRGNGIGVDLLAPFDNKAGFNLYNASLIEAANRKDSPFLTPKDDGELPKVLALTGRGPSGLKKLMSSKGKISYDTPQCKAIKSIVKAYIRAHGIDIVVTDMAEGFDLLAAGAALEVDGVKVVAALPHDRSEQTKYYKSVSRSLYNKILKHADKVQVYEQKGYSWNNREGNDKDNQIQACNRYIMDNADEVFALFNKDGDSDQSFGAVKYAENIKMGDDMFMLDPGKLNQMFKKYFSNRKHKLNVDKLISAFDNVTHIENFYPLIRIIQNDPWLAKDLPDEVAADNGHDLHVIQTAESDEVEEDDSPEVTIDLFKIKESDDGGYKVIKYPNITRPNNVFLDREGTDIVNIYSRSTTFLGQFLSNFTETQIDMDEDGIFQSVEGYWHWLGVPEDAPGRDELRKLSGPAARKIGRQLKEKYGTVTDPDFKEKIRLAIRKKIESTDWGNSPSNERLFKEGFFHHSYISKQNGLFVNQSQFDWVVEVTLEELIRDYEFRFETF